MIFFVFFIINLIVLSVSGQNFQTTIYLYTNRLIDTPRIVNETSNLSEIPGFCRDSATIRCTNYILTHGFRTSPNVVWILRIKNELFNLNRNINVFTIDWSEGASGSIFYYDRTARNVIPASIQAGRSFLAFSRNGYFRNNNGTLNIHCIGRTLISFFKAK